MDSKIFENYTPKERLEMLRSNATKIEEHTYLKSLDNDAITEKQRQLTRNYIEISKHDDVLKEHKEVHKVATKPLKTENATLLQEVKNGGTEVTEKVYMIADYEANMMGVYNANGELISSRPLYATERQYSITDGLRKVSND